MKTPTATMKPATAPRALETQPFTVTTEWVRITTSILARHAEKMQHIPYYQTNPGRFCAWLVKRYQTTNFINSNRRLELECLAHGILTGRKTSPFTFAMEASQWAGIVNLCESINTTPTAFIRAAIAHAAQGWARFDEQTRVA